MLHSIEEGARRTANIVKDLRTFSRLDESELKWVNIHENIDSTLTLLRNLVRDRIAIHKNYGNIPEIECFPGKMNQVFMNLITNAAQAISDHGEITISTHKDNDQIRISVRDTGTGMNKETMARIFEPFFTTKPTGKGSEFIIVLPIKYVA